MITEGVWAMYFQYYIRMISPVQKGRDYSKEDQRHLDRGRSPKRRMTLFHWCQRGRDSHIDVIDDYWLGEIVTFGSDSHIDYWCRACLIYMLTSIICNWCWHQCQRGRLLDHVVIDANGLIDWCHWLMSSDWLMQKDWLIDYWCNVICIVLDEIA